MTYEWEKAFSLTDDESLYASVSYERLLEILQKRGVRAVKDTRSSNNYGEFRFLTLTKGKHAVTFFGHGYHDLREQTMADTWRYYNAAGCSAMTAKPLDKAWLLEDLAGEHAEYAAEAWAERGRRRSAEARQFSLLADLTDEDGAYADLCMDR